MRRVEEDGWTLAAAKAAGVSVPTVSTWLASYRVEGEDGLLDRMSAPRSIPHQTPEERVQAILASRRLRMTAAEIAECVVLLDCDIHLGYNTLADLLPYLDPPTRELVVNSGTNGLAMPSYRGTTQPDGSGTTSTNGVPTTKPPSPT